MGGGEGLLEAIAMLNIPAISKRVGFLRGSRDRFGPIARWCKRGQP